MNRAPVLFRQSDLLANAPQRHWDIIIANLPYVPTNAPADLSIKKEPALALFSGADGLDHYRQLAKQISEISFTSLFIEFLPYQWKSIEQLFSAYTAQPLCDIGGEIYFAHITCDS